MRGFCVAISTVVLVAGSAIGVAAQDESGPEPPVVVTGTRECQQVGDGVSESGENGVEHFRGYTTRCTLTTGDERVNDPSILTYNTDCYPDGKCTVWGTTETEGPDGWRGTYRGWGAVGGDYPALVFVAEGFGTYDGLTFVSGSDSDTDEGVIYEGPPPWEAVLSE